MAKCINSGGFNQLEVGKEYQILDEFIVKFPINCKKKKKEEEFKEVEMVKTNVGNFEKSRFAF